MYQQSEKAIQRLRKICLALPAVIEKEAWGECTFRVTGGKMFAMTDNNHHHSGHLAVWVVAPPTVQETLVRTRPEKFFRPPYVGAKGWVGVRLDTNVDWDELAAILADGCRMSAPATLPRRKSPAQSPVRTRPRAVNSSTGGKLRHVSRPDKL